MTKEEVERLLRHGAYDIFNEEKAGSAEASKGRESELKSTAARFPKDDSRGAVIEDQLVEDGVSTARRSTT